MSKFMVMLVTLLLASTAQATYYDQETGLLYNYFRHYDPKVGRYIQSDPIGLEGGTNPYAYVANDPLTFVDPDGLTKRRGGTPPPTISETFARANVHNLIQRIRQYDPSFRYEIATSGGTRYNRSDVEFLENVLRQQEGAGVCRVYSSRELLRRAEEPGPNHNFPEIFNPTIFGGQRTVVNPNYILYTQPGTLNGRFGTYEIGVRPNGSIEIIVHRFFRPD